MAIRIFEYCLFRLSSTKLQKAASPKQLVSFLKSDVHNPQHAYKIHRIFRALLHNNHFETPATRPLLYECLGLFSKYTRLYPISTSQYDYTMHLIDLNLHRLSSEQLIKSFLYFAKIDSSLSSPLLMETKLYEHFIRYYLKNRFELLKWKLKLWDSSDITIGTFFKKLFSRMLVAKVWSSIPNYDKSIGVPPQLQSEFVHTVMSHPHLAKSALQRKAYLSVFLKAKNFYENQMANNLYHHKNGTLLTHMLQFTKVWTQERPEFQEQNTLMLKLIIKTVLVLNTTNPAFLESIITSSQDLILLYNFVRQKFATEEEDISQFLNIFESVLKKEQYFRKTNILNKLLVLRIAHLSRDLQTQFLQNLLDGINSSSLKIYFHELLDFAKNCPQFRYLLIQKANQLDLHYLNIQQLISFYQQLCLKRKIPALRAQILSAIEKTEEQSRIVDQDILNLLEILADDPADRSASRQSLRSFVFKYISDNHRKFEKCTYLRCFEIIVSLQDSKESFDASDPPVYKSIFEQLQPYNQELNRK